MGTITFKDVDEYAWEAISHAIRKELNKALIDKIDAMCNSELTDEQRHWAIERADEDAAWFISLLDKMEYKK